MTAAELAEIIAQLRAGKRFSTRYTDHEWGIYAQPDGQFCHWSSDHAADQQRNTSISAAQIATLIGHLSYERVSALLR